MYKYLFLCLLSIGLLYQCKEKSNKSLLNSESQSSVRDTVNEYFVTGELKRVSRFVDSIRQDTMFEYFQSGKIRAYKLFKDNLQHGKTTVFYESGKIREVQYYDKDLPILGDTIFHENGNIDMIVNYVNGVKHGDLMLFDSLGVKFYHVRFDNGEIVDVKDLKKKKK